VTVLRKSGSIASDCAVDVRRLAAVERRRERVAEDEPERVIELR
jgi:hypothetical protein